MPVGIVQLNSSSSNDLIHLGTFKEGRHDGYILKAFSSDERHCYEFLQNDILKEFIPKYNGVVQDQDGKRRIKRDDH